MIPFSTKYGILFLVSLHYNVKQVKERVWIINIIIIDQDWIEGEFWFRYDGVTEPECLRHDYTINHETEGIIGVMEKEAVDYVFRNRKGLNKLEQAVFLCFFHFKVLFFYF